MKGFWVQVYLQGGGVHGSSVQSSLFFVALVLRGRERD